MEANLIAQIDQFAVSHPDKSAYDYLGTENTYGDLKKYSDALADYILKMDLPAKAPIVVFGGQTFEMIAAFLGVVKSVIHMFQSMLIHRYHGWNQSMRLGSRHCIFKLKIYQLICRRLNQSLRQS